jgi:hypothetical protein
MLKPFVIAAVLLIPGLAFASDWKWSEYYEGVAGGSLKDQEATKELAVQKAHILAVGKACALSPYSLSKTPGLVIGMIEPPVTCQCVDDVCICTDKVEVVCLSQDK